MDTLLNKLGTLVNSPIEGFDRIIFRGIIRSTKRIVESAERLSQECPCHILGKNALGVSCFLFLVSCDIM